MGLSVWDILFAAMVSLILTIVILKVLDFWKIITGDKEMIITYRINDLSKTLQKCYTLFPIEIISFQGKEFKRGMTIRVLTSQNKILEGRLLGINNDNILCLMTKQFIIAHEIEDIEDIENIEGIGSD